MAQGTLADNTQLPQMVAWLDEQRRLDKDQLLVVQQDIERLSVSIREITAHVSRVQEDAAQNQSRLATLPTIESGFGQAREQILILQQRVEANQAAREKDVLLHRAEAERDHRALVDLGQQILELRKLIEIDQAKVRAVADEVSRVKPPMEIVAGQIESLDKSISGIASRVHTAEEQVRRQDSRAAVLDKVVDTLQSEYSRMLQWQQAADLRWSRQLSGWQQQMDDWKREAEDRVKLVQQFMKQITAVKEEVTELRARIGENKQRHDDQLAETLRLQGLRAHDREEIRRVEQALEVQRQRIDEQAGTIKQLQEQFLRDVQDLGSLGVRLETEQRRAQETAAQVTHLDQRQRQAVDSLEHIRREIREFNQQFQQHVQRWQVQVEEDRRKLDEQFEDLQRMDEQQKLREIAELERQIMEIRERMVKVKAG